jgi:hypothetical protein
VSATPFLIGSLYWPRLKRLLVEKKMNESYAARVVRNRVRLEENNDILTLYSHLTLLPLVYLIFASLRLKFRKIRGRFLLKFRTTTIDSYYSSTLPLDNTLDPTVELLYT